MKNLFKLLLIGIIAIACKKNNNNFDTNNELLISKINTSLVNLNSLSNTSSYIYVEYNENKKLTKKIGGFLYVPSSAGYAEIFTDKIYTSVIYQNNKVTIEDFSSTNDFNVPKNTRHFTLNPSSNKIELKEVPSTDNNGNKKLVFIYTNDKLTEIKTSFPNRIYNPTDPYGYLLTYSEKFYYDTNDNLIKTEYFEQHNGINTGKRITRTFENYDNSSNPFRALYLLDEFFYRSISKNNFRKYSEFQYQNDVLGSSITKSWTFDYDSKGQIIVN